MTTYEIVPDQSITALAHIPSLTARSLDTVYSTLRRIATVADVNGAVSLSGTYAVCDNVLIARVRQLEPFYSQVTDSWCRVDSDYRTVEVTR